MFIVKLVKYIIENLVEFNIMGLRDIYNSIGSGIKKVSGSLSDAFSDNIQYNKAQMYGPKQPVPKVEGDMYTRASNATKDKYGFAPPPHFLKAVNQQESSGIVDESDYDLSMGMTDTAKADLGNDYLEPTSVDNVVQNASNYLALRGRGTYDSGETYDWSTPENYVDWYVRQYVGLKPGESREINGQMVSHEDIKKLFEKQLMQAKQ